MKKYLLLPALALLLGFQLQAQSCAFPFAAGTVGSTESCMPTGNYVYNINVSIINDSVVVFTGLWSASQQITAEIDCNTQTFTIAPQFLLVGYDIQGNGSIVSPNVQVRYGVYQMPGHVLVDSCTLLYPMVGLGVAPTAQASLTLYPNPATGQAHIQLQTTAVNTDCTYRICDLQGRVIASGVLDSHLEAQINLNTLVQGMYHVMVQNEDGPLASKVLVVE